jgi:hypothetical protein
MQDGVRYSSSLARQWTEAAAALQTTLNTANTSFGSR